MNLRKVMNNEFSAGSNFKIWNEELRIHWTEPYMDEIPCDSTLFWEKLMQKLITLFFF